MVAMDADYDKVRMYHDFPILLDYLRANRNVRNRNIHTGGGKCKTTFKYPKYCNDDDFGQAVVCRRPEVMSSKLAQSLPPPPPSYSRGKKNSISFTRKIIDINHRRKSINNEVGGGGSRTKSPSSLSGYLENLSCKESYPSRTPLSDHLISIDQHVKCKNKLYHVENGDGSLYRMNRTIIDRSNLMIYQPIHDEDLDTKKTTPFERWDNSLALSDDQFIVWSPNQTIQIDQCPNNESETPERNQPIEYNDDDDWFQEDQYKQLPVTKKGSGQKATIPSTTPMSSLSTMSLIERILSCQEEDELPMMTSSTTIPNWEELCERIYRLSPNDRHGDDWKVFPATGHVSLCSRQQLATVVSEDFPEDQICFNHTGGVQNNKNNHHHQNNNGISFPVLQIGTEEIEESVENFDLKRFISEEATRIFLLKNETKHRQHDNGGNINNAMLFSERIKELPYGNECYPMTPYRSFLFDLCKEQILEMFRVDSVPEPNHDGGHADSEALTLMLPLRMQKQPWPLEPELFTQLLYDCIDGLIDRTGQPRRREKQQRFDRSPCHIGGGGANNSTITAEDKVKETDDNGVDDDGADDFSNKYNIIQKTYRQIKRFGLMAFCREQRKLDFVDRVLYQEMLHDQARWSFFDPEIREIKNLIADMILEELVQESIETNHHHIPLQCLM